MNNKNDDMARKKKAKQSCVLVLYASLDFLFPTLLSQSMANPTWSITWIVGGRNENHVSHKTIF
ncbi:CLUMA_CG019273, isoform A [Clunio marinus]|uniref:CLUMA_CG019273, isoform A n=1 Tax=Clunio marinus TaxID=568069 RepID=A0A1J1J107_9DIPT|nr:CLUMA_CG019273, isoform A [Clunio marinus]